MEEKKTLEEVAGAMLSKEKKVVDEIKDYEIINTSKANVNAIFKYPNRFYSKSIFFFINFGI